MYIYTCTSHGEMWNASRFRDEIYMQIWWRYAILSLIHSCPMLLGYIIFAFNFFLFFAFCPRIRLPLLLLLLSSSLFFYSHSMISFSHLDSAFGMVPVISTVCIAHFKFFIYSLSFLTHIAQQNGAEKKNTRQPTHRESPSLSQSPVKREFCTEQKRQKKHLERILCNKLN